MILYCQREWIIPEAHLLDDVVGRAPRFDIEAVRDPIDPLMVRTIYFFESMTGGCVVTQRLNIIVFLFGQLVTRNIELERPAKSDIQDLDAFANAENRQTARERFRNRVELPAVPRCIHLLIDQAWIENFLVQKFRRDIRAARQEQSVHLVHRNIVLARIENIDVRMLHKKWL